MVVALFLCVQHEANITLYKLVSMLLLPIQYNIHYTNSIFIIHRALSSFVFQASTRILKTKLKRICPFLSYPPWNLVSEKCVFGHRKQQIRLDGLPKRRRIMRFHKKIGSLWTGPHCRFEKHPLSYPSRTKGFQHPTPSLHLHLLSARRMCAGSFRSRRSRRLQDLMVS